MHLRIMIVSILTGFLCSCKVAYTSDITSDVFYKPGDANVLSSDSAISKEIAPYKVKLDETMNEVLAFSKTAMEKGQPESKLGNFVADLCLYIVNTEPKNRIIEDANFCVLNNGGLRTSLPEGAIKRKNVFELMPFENELVIITMKGDSVLKLFEYIAKKGGVPISGLKLNIENDVASNVVIQGQPFNANQNYRVLTSDYLSNGGDAMIMFGAAIKVESTGIKVRDAIINYLVYKNANGEIIDSEKDGRISK